MTGLNFRIKLAAIVIAATFMSLNSCGSRTEKGKTVSESTAAEPIGQELKQDNTIPSTTALLVSPEKPRPGEVFRVMITGGEDIRNTAIEVKGASGTLHGGKVRTGDGLPHWKIVEFKAESEGKYHVSAGGKTPVSLDFNVTIKPSPSTSGAVWITRHGWSSREEALYSAWINALFQNSDERSSWKALNETTENKEDNFLYNHLSLGEDDAAGKNKVLMQPDCADNPFYLRAYFSWKLGLPFGYHECDRGYLGKAPNTGRWITNETGISKNNPTQKFNAFARMVMNGVHSGTARTAFKDESSDYYPVPLTRTALRPGIVFADPYGHTLILVRTIPQTNQSPGVLLAVDAQPDKTVAIKRFWQGNFLFNTNPKEVIGEPGFKAFRPIVMKDGKVKLLKSEEINANPNLIPFSLQQKGMESATFYHILERVINPKPMDPEMAMLDLVNALYEQLNVRINSVGTGEEYMKSHPGTVVPMPGGTSGVFQAGGQWEDFSTPNRDMRLLIAMDAVQNFPEKVLRSPEDYKLSTFQSPEKARKNLEALLEKKINELSITYTRSNGSKQTLTVAEILKRKDAFEMAYNPNDGPEIRWGAPEKSEERSTCKRRAPAGQVATMTKVRGWFKKRLHPPT